MDRGMLLEIRVKCEEAMKVTGHTRDIVIIPFSGEAEGPPERRVIFADFCVIEAALLEAENTVFKKIPRDIGRL